MQTRGMNACLARLCFLIAQTPGPRAPLVFHSSYRPIKQLRTTITDVHHRMQEGSFLVVTSRQAGVPNWLPFRKFGSDSALQAKFEEHLLSAQQASRELSTNAGIAATPLTFSQPGGFGVALQGTQETAGGLSVRKQPICFTTKRAAIFFQGYLSNVEELVSELFSSVGSELSSSYGSSAGSYTIKPDGDQASVSAEIILQMYTQNSSDSDKLPMLLSELQGEYSFVIYDAKQRQVFAARDPNGREPLYVDFEADGGVAVTNTLADPTWGRKTSSTWQEVLPGHFYGGKQTKGFQQFALTPLQLRMREYADSLDEISCSPPYLSSVHSTTTELKMRGSNEEDTSPLSNRSSLEQGFPPGQLFRISV